MVYKVCQQNYGASICKEGPWLLWNVSEKFESSNKFQISKIEFENKRKNAFEKQNKSLSSEPFSGPTSFCHEANRSLQQPNPTPLSYRLPQAAAWCCVRRPIQAPRSSPPTAADQRGDKNRDDFLILLYLNIAYNSTIAIPKLPSHGSQQNIQTFQEPIAEAMATI
jgi:hypothetical protein